MVRKRSVGNLYGAEGWEDLPLIVDPNQHLRLVHKTVRGIYKNVSDDDLEDLTHAGMIGLLRACRTYDASTGNKFSTHAVWWIRGYSSRLWRRKRYNAGFAPIRDEAGKWSWKRVAHVASADKCVKQIESLRDNSTAERDHEVDELIDRACGQDASIVRRSVLLGESHDSIATSLGISRSRVGQRAARGLQRLREHSAISA